METLFWTCLLLGLYPYVGYPALAWLFARLINRGVAADAGYTPAVTVVISAYNEDRHIRATVLNKLEQDYPRISSMSSSCPTARKMERTTS